MENFKFMYEIRIFKIHHQLVNLGEPITPRISHTHVGCNFCFVEHSRGLQLQLAVLFCRLGNNRRWIGWDYTLPHQRDSARGSLEYFNIVRGEFFFARFLWRSTFIFHSSTRARLVNDLNCLIKGNMKNYFIFNSHPSSVVGCMVRF